MAALTKLTKEDEAAFQRQWDEYCDLYPHMRGHLGREEFEREQFAAELREKEAAEAVSSLPPAPRRKSARRKSDAYMFESMGKAVGKAVALALEPLKDRIKALEERPIPEFQGLGDQISPIERVPLSCEEAPCGTRGKVELTISLAPMTEQNSGPWW